MDKAYIVGLGNPGAKYARTPHNLGFRVLEQLSLKHGLPWDILKDGCRTASGWIQGHSVTLIQPCHYMNRSGETLLNWARRNPLVPVSESGWPEIVPLVVCDDISLPLGSLRLRPQGRDGGHKGLDSIASAGWGLAYPRLRLGVADDEIPLRPEVWADFVLADFDDRDWESSQEQVIDAAEAVVQYLELGIEAAASRCNRRGFPAAG